MNYPRSNVSETLGMLARTIAHEAGTGVLGLLKVIKAIHNIRYVSIHL